MAFSTERYCETLDQLDPAKAIRAIHQALLQLQAAQSGYLDNLDHAPAIEALADCMKDAGHMGATR